MATIQVAGHIARDAETRFNPNGKSFTKFSIAENVYKNGNQEGQFFNCTIFGERGEKLSQYIQKGGAATVFGVLHVEKYTGKDGIERQSNEIIVGDIVLQGGKQDGKGSNPPPAPQRQDSTATQRAQVEDINEDIPF